MTTPNDATLLAIMKHAKPSFGSDTGKIAYIAHLLAEVQECSLIGINTDSYPEDVAAAPELSLEPGWDSGHLLQLLYRTPKQSLLEVKVLQMGDSSMVHWGRQGSAVHSVEVAPADYVTGVTDGAAAYQRERLNGLIGKFAAGLQLTIQERDGAPQDDTAAALQSAAPASSDGAAPQRREPPPDTSGGMHPQPSPLAVGHDDLHPAGLRQPLQGGPSLMAGGPSGSQVGPDHPMFQGGPDRLGGQRGPGGAGIRFDPIAPEGMPGFHPDDFTPAQRQADAWNDVGPPPGMAGRRGGPGGGPGHGMGPPGMGGGAGGFGSGAGLGGRRGGGFGGGGFGGGMMR